MVTSSNACKPLPIASSTNATPPDFGLSRYLKGEFCPSCFSWVKRVPSTKFITATGMLLNFSQALRVTSISRRPSSGFFMICLRV
ncbi:hypothetical protein D3C71_1841660 [compost metagenome]